MVLEAPMPERRETILHEHLMLMSRFVRNPRMIGAIAPSSRALAEAMIGAIDFSRPVNVVELGPGMGAFTGLLQSRLAPGSRFVAVEIDPVFARELRARWPALDVANAAAEDLPRLLEARGLAAVDHVISGLPFVSLPAPVVQRTLKAVGASIRPGGTLTTFQYVHSFNWPTAVQSRRLIAQQLSAADPRTRLVIRNLPPAVVLTWTSEGRPTT
jgi:phospholipid N-methyltransferase